MNITRVEIRNIRSVREIVWEIQPGQAPGWHVILGDNGAGKSTFLRSIALALIGPFEAAGLRQNWNEWLTHESEAGQIKIKVVQDLSTDLRLTLSTDPILHQSYPPSIVEAGIGFERKETTGEKALSKVKPRGIVQIEPINHQDAFRSLWHGGTGWFSASYGPYRRFAGNRQDESTSPSQGKLARHLSVFGEEVALTEALEWVKKLQFKKLENEPEGLLLDSLTRFVNQPDFLPHEARMRNVTSEGVMFVDGNNREISVLELSDGYRSILSMTFELIRQLMLCYGPSEVFETGDTPVVKASGVVLIDEVDVHLHPSWQRKVGQWFRKYFPKLQFIVTTHSPLICQAAEVGTVYRLPTPGTDESGKMLDGQELNRLLYGNILDAYSTGAFGENVTRSATGKQRLKRLAELNVRSMNESLTRDEASERARLQASTPTAAQTMEAPASVGE